MSKQIPKNQDHGDLKDRVRVISLAAIISIQELKGRVDMPIFVVSSQFLCNVLGLVKDGVKAEPAVTVRLVNIENLYIPEASTNLKKLTLLKT